MVDPASAVRSEPLSRESVVAAGLRVLADAGADGLTMRAVADELRASPMALYHHVANKEELVRAIVREVLSRVEPLVLGSDGWEASLRRHLASVWREQARYPGVNRLLFTRPMPTGDGGAITYGIDFFVSAGFTAEEARLAWVFAMTFIHGRLSAESIVRHDDRTDRHAAGPPAHAYAAYGIDAVIAGIAALRTQGTSGQHPAGIRTETDSRSAAHAPTSLS